VHELITTTLTPYGFRLPGCSGKQGYTLGLALLSRQHGDPGAEGLSRELAARLSSCGIALPRPESSGAGQGQRRVQLSRFDRDPGQAVELCGWPLQLLHHREHWWLLLEHDHIGHACGLLAAIPIAQLRWQGIRDSRGRDPLRHGQALRWAERLRQFCAGLELGPNLQAQQALLQAGAAERRALLHTVKLRCTAAVMAEIQQELGRFHPAACAWHRPCRGIPGGRPPVRGAACGLSWVPATPIPWSWIYRPG
jgi:hypothetical protein